MGVIVQRRRGALQRVDSIVRNLGVEGQAAVHSVLQRRLLDRVKRGIQGVAAGIEGIPLLLINLMVMAVILLVFILIPEAVAEFKSVSAHQIADGTVNRIGCLIVVHRHLLPLHHHLLGDGLRVLLLGDISHILHVGEDLVAPLHRPFRVIVGVIVGGPVRNRTEVGGLAQGQLICTLVEVALGCRFQSVVIIGIVDVVHIEFHQLLFAVLLRQIQGNQHLLEFSLHRHFPGQEPVSRQLLGNGTGAVHLTAVRADIVHHDAENASHVDSGVLPEGTVFDGHKGIHRILRDLLIRQVTGILVTRQFSDDLAVGVINIAGFLQSEGVEIALGNDVLCLLPVIFIDGIQLPVGSHNAGHRRTDPQKHQCFDHRQQHADNRTEKKQKRIWFFRPVRLSIRVFHTTCPLRQRFLSFSRKAFSTSPDEY